MDPWAATNKLMIFTNTVTHISMKRTTRTGMEDNFHPAVFP